MNREETKAAIKVMQAWVDEVPLQVRQYSSRKWVDGVTNPCWNWDEWHWRIKPQPVEVKCWAVVFLFPHHSMLTAFSKSEAERLQAIHGGIVVELTGTYMEDTP